MRAALAEVKLGGFLLLEHTADVGILASGESLSEALSWVAKGMFSLIKDMDEVNPTFQQTDLVLVIGANDVVNPLARGDDPSIPIAGMPILDVDQARTVVVIKRSLSPGFAGIANPLFAADNTLMLYGGARQMTLELVAALRQGARTQAR